ncbi:MAG: anti-sigma factor family protein, partial [Planctomycetota bacterium]
MTCHDYKDIMMGYLDNELSNEQKRQFEEHLTG